MAKRETVAIEVIDSCGCVFADLGRPRPEGLATKVDGRARPASKPKPKKTAAKAKTPR